MKFVYSAWDDALFARLQDMSDLAAIFNYLLMRLNGDVDETLKLMRRLQEQGMLDAKYDLDEFEKQLKENRLIRQIGDKLGLTGKGGAPPAAGRV